MREAHISVREFHVVWRFLRDHQTLTDQATCFETDNTAGVFCTAKQGTAKSETLLSLSEQILEEAYQRGRYSWQRMSPANRAGGRTLSPGSEEHRWSGRLGQKCYSRWWNDGVCRRWICLPLPRLPNSQLLSPAFGGPASSCSTSLSSSGVLNREDSPTRSVVASPALVLRSTHYLIATTSSLTPWAPDYGDPRSFTRGVSPYCLEKTILTEWWRTCYVPCAPLPLAHTNCVGIHSNVFSDVSNKLP